MSVGLLVQEKMGKTDFQDGHCGGQLGFLISMILAISISFPAIVQETKGKIDFQDGHNGCQDGHNEVQIVTILATFDLQIVPLFSYQVSSQLAFWFWRSRQNRFSRWLPCPPSWILDRNNFSYFLATTHPDTSFQV